MKDLDLALNILSRGVVAFLGFIHLFSQLFFAIYEWHTTAVGIGAFALAGLTGWRVKSAPVLNRIGLIGGAAVLIGLGVGVYDYYAHLQSPGNYHAWFITIPMVVCAIYLMDAVRRGAGLR